MSELQSLPLVIRQRTDLCLEYLRSKSVDTPVGQNQAKVSEYEGRAAFLSRFDKQLAIDNIKILSQHVSQLGMPSPYYLLIKLQIFSLFQYEK